MSVHTVPPLTLIPENAPFTLEQRSWLSGYFAAPPRAGGDGRDAPRRQARLRKAADGPPLADNGDAPWHDPSLALDERMQMAAERPLAPRLMAAMAQQDCGQCGYSCADYANALFLKKEERLNLCVPGGKETLRAVKKLAEELDKAKAESAAPASAGRRRRRRPCPGRRARPLARESGRGDLPVAAPAQRGGVGEGDLARRDRPVGLRARLRRRRQPRRLSAERAGARRRGDRPARREAGADHRRAQPCAISCCTTRCLGAAPDALFQLLSYLTGGEARRKARALASRRGSGRRRREPRRARRPAQVRRRPARMPEAFLEALEPLQPRLYSISSSPKSRPGPGLAHGRRRALPRQSSPARSASPRPSAPSASRRARRCASTSRRRTASRLPAGSRRAGHHGRSRHRRGAVPRLPARARGDDGARPQLAVLRPPAPGLRFLLPRRAQRAEGRGHLTRLTLAWSRDGEGKIYVQDRMREVGAELWKWLGEGAHFYVCGDAKRMAKDVERALVDIVAVHGDRRGGRRRRLRPGPQEKRPLPGRRLLSADDGPRARTDRCRSR